MQSYLLLSFHLLLPGGVNGIHHPFDGEVGDSPKDGEAEDQPHHLIAAQGPREGLGVHHPPSCPEGKREARKGKSELEKHLQGAGMLLDKRCFTGSWDK